MSTTNIHSEYINDRIMDILENSTKWNTFIVNTSHENFINDFSNTLFSKLITTTFTKAYMKKNPCSKCNKPSEERCHGIGEERPILIKRALERVWCDTSKPIRMLDIVVAFLEEHRTTSFSLKCKECHKKEPKPPRRKSMSC